MKIPGYNPKLHASKLKAGLPVTLDDGSIIDPSLVCEKPKIPDPAQCFAFIFLEDESYV